MRIIPGSPDPAKRIDRVALAAKWTIVPNHSGVIALVCEWTGDDASDVAAEHFHFRVVPVIAWRVLDWNTELRADPRHHGTDVIPVLPGIGLMNPHGLLLHDPERGWWWGNGFEEFVKTEAEARSWLFRLVRNMAEMP